MAAEWFLTDSGGSPLWALSDVETPATAADAPSAVSADPTGGTTLTINWTPAVTGGVPSGFDVQLESPTGSGNWVAAAGAANPTAAGAASFPAASLSVVTSYTPRVRAKSTGFADSAWTVGLPVSTDNSVTGGGVIGSADTTAPAFPNGSSIAITGLTATGYTATCAAATDAVGVTGYQWRIGGAGAWADIAGGGRSFTFTGRTPASTDALEMRARDGSGNFSVPLATAVTMLGIAPAVTAQPGNVSVADGATATFTAAFSGTPAPALQWARNGAPISGATSASYSFTAALGDSGAVFVCTATNSAGSIASNAAVLTVTPALVAPSIVTQPASQSIVTGNLVTFSVVAAGSTPLAYQWRRNGTPISGATGSSYSFTTVDGDAGAALSVVVTNAAGSVTSSTATLTLTTGVQALDLYTLKAPQDQVVHVGGFAPKDPAADVVLAFQFKRYTSTPSSPDVTITRLRGAADAAPNAVLSGPPAVVGSVVFQRVVGGVPYCDYLMRCEADGPDGSRYPMVGILPIRPL